MLNDVSLPDRLGFRAVEKSDHAFIQQLFNSTRDHLRGLPLPAQHIDVLLEQQYRLQQAHYARQWPNAETRVIQRSGKAVGKIILDESETALHIVDIVLEPAVRGKGYGTTIIRAVQKAAHNIGLPIKLSVDRQNPMAKKLYTALGFKVTETSETHEAMVWSPFGPAASGDFFTQELNCGPVKSPAFR